MGVKYVQQLFQKRDEEHLEMKDDLNLMLNDWSYMAVFVQLWKKNYQSWYKSSTGVVMNFTWMHRFQNKYLKRLSRDKDSSMQKYFDLEKLDKMISKIRARNINYD